MCLRNNSSYKRGRSTVGTEAIFHRMAAFEQNYTMEWKPDTITVNLEEGIGVTMGNYIFTTISSRKSPPEKGTGRYLTVWKKQASGEWRAIFDLDQPIS